VRIQLKISGQLDGEATTFIGAPGGGISEYPLTLRGKFSESLEGDWYSLDTNLRYESRGVTTGTVKIEYEYL